MWHSYFYKLEKNLTTADFYLPRWIDFGQDQSLFDDIPIPTLQGVLTDTPTYLLTPFTSGTPNSTNNLNMLFEAFENEKQQLQNIIVSVGLDGQGYFDLSQPSYLWVAYCTDTVSSLMVQSASGLVEVQKADDLLDLFNAADWRWYQQGQTLILFGFDLIEQTAYSDNLGWQFMKHINYWDGYSTVFLEHPSSKNWFPILSSSIRTDGFLSYQSNTPIRIRSRNYNQAHQHQNLLLTINSVTALVTAVRTDLWNGVDEKAQWVNLSRRSGESNSDLATWSLLASWFQSSDISGLRSYISAALRTGTVLNVSSASSGIDLPAVTGYKIKNVSQHVFPFEQLSPDQSTADLFRSLYSDPILGSISVGNSIVNYSVSGNLIDIDTHIFNKVTQPIASWMIRYWVHQASSLIFTDNMPLVPDFTVYCSTDVDIVDPSDDTMVSSFQTTSPVFKWRSQVSNMELKDIQYVVGLVDFGT